MHPIFEERGGDIRASQMIVTLMLALGTFHGRGNRPVRGGMIPAYFPAIVFPMAFIARVAANACERTVEPFQEGVSDHAQQQYRNLPSWKSRWPRTSNRHAHVSQRTNVGPADRPNGISEFELVTLQT